jgi:ELWxxDGT repeat protein
VLFGADDGVRGNEPWRSDGTAAGTFLLKDIVSGSAGSGMGWAAPVIGPSNTEVGMFKAGTGLWKTDGTAAGTVNVVQLNLINAGMSWVTPLGDSVFYSATGNSGNELYKSSSVAPGAVMLTDNPGSYRGTPNATMPDNIMAVNGHIFFSGYRESTGWELWSSSGTFGGTALVQELVLGTSGSNPSDFTSAAGTIFFIASHPVYGRELWRLDEVIPGPTVSIDDVNLVEGHSGTSNASFTVTLSSPSTQTITVQFLTANGTASAGSDYQSTGGTLTFLPGQTSRSVSVIVNGDLLGEAHETFFVNLSYPQNATIADGQGVGSILDDEPRVSINDVSLTEGNSGTKVFTFAVTLSAALSENVTLSFRTLNGTATSSGGQADFVSQTGTLTFVPGDPSLSKTISIVVKGDTKKEGNETFNAELFNLSNNAWFLDNLGLGTILNDD